MGYVMSAQSKTRGANVCTLRSMSSSADPGATTRPTWDDHYLDELAARLAHSYDLQKDRQINSRSFPLYGYLELHRQKQVLHPALSFAHHQLYEHVLVTTTDTISQQTVSDLVELGHTLADEWIDPGEEHYSTEFSFGVVTDHIPKAVTTAVSTIDERTMLKYGFNGHYDINIIVVAPEQEALIANDTADIAEAFRHWPPADASPGGLFDRLFDYL